MKLRWTSEDDQFLRDNYRQHGAFHCAQALARGEAPTRQRAYLLKLTFNNLWDESEDSFLREHYTICTNDELSLELGRSASAIKDRARRLGISTRDLRPWSPEDHQLLLDSHGKLTAQEIATKLKRTKAAVVSRIHHYITKPSANEIDLTASDLPKAAHYNPFLTGRIGGKANV